jgi:putative transposase
MHQLFLANGTRSFALREIEKNGVFNFNREENLVDIGAYCLMPNHFHILLTPRAVSGAQIFLQKLSTGYSMYFNKKYNRTGSLFEGKFKSKIADSDEYLKYLFSYIHLNPIALIDPTWKESDVSKISFHKNFLEGYSYSSYKDFTSTRLESVIINPAAFPEYFSTVKEFDGVLTEWLTASSQGLALGNLEE